MGICGCYIAPEARGLCPRASHFDAGWSSPVARQAHNLKVVGSNPTPATKFSPPVPALGGVEFFADASGIKFSVGPTIPAISRILELTLASRVEGLRPSGAK